MGDEGPGKGGVADDAKAFGLKDGMDRIDHPRGGRGAETVAENHLRRGAAGAAVMLNRLMRH